MISSMDLTASITNQQTTYLLLNDQLLRKVSATLQSIINAVAVTGRRCLAVR